MHISSFMTYASGFLAINRYIRELTGLKFVCPVRLLVLVCVCERERVCVCVLHSAGSLSFTD